MSPMKISEEKVQEIRRLEILSAKPIDRHRPIYTLVTSMGKLRNDGIGDYFETPDGDWKVLAARMENPLHSELILVHELVEVMLTRAAGIPEPVIDAWDAYFAVLRQNGLVEPDAQPGDDPRAPYHKQHRTATKIEEIMCTEGFALPWNKEKETAVDTVVCGEMGR